MRAAWAALRRAMANRSIRSMQLGWLTAIAAETAFVVNLLVFAYGVGGVLLVGVAGMLRTLPAALSAPFLGMLADRLPRERVLLGVHVGRGAAIGLAAVAVAIELPAAVVFGCAVVEGMLATLHRPTTMSLLPALARSPDELVGGNVTVSVAEGLGVLTGPAVGGALLLVGVPWLGFGVPAMGFGIAAVTTLAIGRSHSVAPAADIEPGAKLHEALGGIRALRADRHARLLVGVFGTQTFVRGLLSVLLVAASVQLLGLGESGVGYLQSAIGAGGFIGAMVALSVILRISLSGPLGWSLAAWGLPILVVGVVPHAAVALLMMAVIGAANAVLDVSAFTLLQRNIPNRVRGRVFSVLEAVVALTIGIGSLVAPLLVELLGLRGALIATGALLPVLAVVSRSGVRAAEEAAIVPAAQMELIRGVPMFAPLPLTVIEQLAQGMVPVSFGDGQTVIVQGEAGDCWYVIVQGSVDVVHDGTPVAQLGSGDNFGEIALLRNVPRTASVVAREPLTAYRLDRSTFLAAVTGDALSVKAADSLVGERLTALGHGGTGQG